MKNTQEKNMQQLVEQMTKASQQVTQEYIKNIPNLLHTGNDIANVFLSLTNKITSHPEEMTKVQSQYFEFLQKQMELCKSIAEQKPGKEYKPVITTVNGDKRFKADEWNQSPNSQLPNYFDVIKQSYLLMSQFMSGIVEQVELDEITKKKLKFYTKQFLDALSPANFIATNPEVQKLVQQTNGQCLIDGFKNLLADIEKGRISQTDSSAFEVGKNLAVTKGAVVFENKMFQLIQYSPLTKKS